MERDHNSEIPRLREVASDAGIPPLHGSALHSAQLPKHKELPLPAAALLYIVTALFFQFCHPLLLY